MLNRLTQNNDSWGISHTVQKDKILIQIMNDKEEKQVRIALSLYEAKQMLQVLSEKIEVVSEYYRNRQNG